MMMMEPKKDEATVKALEVLSVEHKEALAAQIDAEGGKMDKAEANTIIRSFNEKFIAMGGMKSFALYEVK